MNNKTLYARTITLLLMFMLGWQLPAYAALTDISNTPLSAPNTSVVRPNLMFILDDSGSMEQDYTPDAAAQNYLGFGSPDRWCYDSGDDGTAGTLEVSDASNNRNDVCRTGDVPYFSPDTNFQYYNPEVTYTRPVCFNGLCGTYPDITPTAAKTDGYGRTNKNQLGSGVTTVNLTTEYPERVWCDATDATATDTTRCRTNTAPAGSNAYLYPDVGFTRGRDGSNNVKYKFGAPHYFRLQVSEYCTTEDLTNCVAATSPTGSYVYPARIRWCENASQTDLATPSAGCQARYDRNHAVPRYLGKVNAAASATLSKTSFTVTTSTSGLQITQVLVNGVNIINTTINGTGSNNSTAQAICNAINSHTSSPDYTAGTGTSSTTSCGTSSAQINIAAVLPVAPANYTTPNGYTISIVGPGAVSPQQATGTITVSSTGAIGSNKNSRINDIRVGAVSIISGPLNFTDGTNTTAVASAIAAAINSRASTPEFTATADGNVVTVTASVAGAGGNGALTVTATATSPTATLTFSTVNSGSSTTSVRLNNCSTGTPIIMNTTVNASGSSSGARRNNMASSVRSNINTLTPTTGFSATSSNEVVTVTAPSGSNYNGQTMCVNKTGTLSWSSGTFANGRDAQPMTTVDMSGGVALSGTIATTASSAVFAGGAEASSTSRTGTGVWERTDIIPSVTTYPKAATRTDCAAAASCTYAEELQNFANWYGYYRTRMNLMKTAVGQTFLDIDDDFRVGFITINVGSSSSKYLKLAKFDPTQKQNWYSRLYSQTPGGSTPLREALSRVGRYYGGKTNGINAVTTDDPVEYDCQQCFSLLTTDGFWNGNAGQKLDTTAIGNQDNATSVPRPYFDGGTTTNASDSLSDVAYYYYNTDLRPDLDDLVPDIDDKTHRDRPQHMVTYTLGLGVNGNMIYKDDYKEPTTTSDYRFVANTTARTSSNCTWQTSGTNCEWPKPVENDETAIDDLWHAAVNGHGKYFSARDPNSLSSGLRSALEEMRGQVGAAAAAATSNANIKSGDNYVYSATFTTVEWTGEVVAQEINITTGEVLPTKLWSAQTKLEGQVGSNTDSRTIYMFDAGETNKLTPFTWSELVSSSLSSYFSNGCVASTGHTALLQCASMDAGTKALVNNGEYMVNFLRGQSEYEGTIYRDRAKVMGDAAHSTPAYVRAPLYDYADAVSPSYSNFKATNSARQEMLYIAANDGFLHAINASNDGNGGTEIWAYAPRMVFPTMYHLADTQYADNHRYYVDGSPAVMDIYDGTAWRTILVGGLGAGGRGYFALDITNPTSPKALWERCSDATLCPDVNGIDLSDQDMGLSYGVPVITKLPSTSSYPGEWVVLLTSGYNNVTPGDGEGYLYVVRALTGELLFKVGTNVGTSSNPSGLAKIAAWADNANTDNTSKWVYGGDLLGNMWKFDLTQSTPVATRLGEALDPSGAVQAITSRPELGKVPDFADPVIFFGTGRYLGSCDVDFESGCATPDVTTQVQTVYAIKDRIFTDDGTTGGSYFADGLRDNDAGLVEQVLSETTVDGEPIRIVNSANEVDWSDPAVGGWYIDLTLSTGERVDVDPQLVLGTLVVVGNVPEAGTSNACSVGGSSWLYQFDFQSGAYLDSLSSTRQVGGRVSDTALTVGIVVFRLPGGALKSLATDATGGMIPMAVTTENPGTAPHRSNWREIIR